MPSASAADVAGEGLNQVLAVRPELAAVLKKVLAFPTESAPADAVSQLKNKDPLSFGVVAELVAGAYFLNPQVRASLGYDGQTARPIDPRPDYLDEGLLQSVIDRGPIYRPTPGQEQRPPRN
jgi:hypothetical protein